MEKRIIRYPGISNEAHLTKDELTTLCINAFEEHDGTWRTPDEMAHYIWEKSRMKENNFATKDISERLEKATDSLFVVASCWFDQQPGIVKSPDPSSIYLARIGCQIAALKLMVNMLENFLNTTQVLRGE